MVVTEEPKVTELMQRIRDYRELTANLKGSNMWVRVPKCYMARKKPVVTDAPPDRNEIVTGACDCPGACSGKCAGAGASAGSSAGAGVSAGASTSAAANE